MIGILEKLTDHRVTENTKMHHLIGLLRVSVTPWLIDATNFKPPSKPPGIGSIDPE